MCRSGVSDIIPPNMESRGKEEQRFENEMHPGGRALSLFPFPIMVYVFY